jgi:hypothetical protein
LEEEAGCVAALIGKIPFLLASATKSLDHDNNQTPKKKLGRLTISQEQVARNKSNANWHCIDDKRHCPNDRNKRLL